MKTLIIGSQGMLGSELMSEFSGYYPLGLDKDELDITKPKMIEAFFRKEAPELVINAAAYTDVDACQDNQELAYEVNGRGVGFLAKYCRQFGSKLIHYSTDYVFNGQKKAGYDENDTPDPVSVYGKSKLLGEKLIQEQTDNFYILRTAWLYGPNGPNFVKTMLDLADKKKEIKVVNDQHGSPTHALDLAQKTKEIIEKNQDFGIYHTTNAGSCTWYELARAIFKIAQKEIKLLPVTSDQFPRPALRPQYSILNNNKLKPMRKWPEALREFLTKIL
ncbi:MAG: dTDP-4-dehydrorhamnose reductase [Patescibacteria group bacterium]|nr:dTDP-4-dehydrorhamnose reductase [Patescibacteria group bacterium]